MEKAQLERLKFLFKREPIKFTIEVENHFDELYELALDGLKFRVLCEKEKNMWTSMARNIMRVKKDELV